MPAKTANVLSKFLRRVRVAAPPIASLQQQMEQLLILTRITEERSRTLEHALAKSAALLETSQEQLHSLQTVVGHFSSTAGLVQVLEERSRSHEHELLNMHTLLKIAEERSRSLEHQLQQVLMSTQHQVDFSQRWYAEAGALATESPIERARRAAKDLVLETAHPVANDSHDHLVPQSTMEGLSRPTPFVIHCVDILGPDLLAMDIGTGAAGLVYEFAMNGVTALGIDGSDYCRRHRIGYWPMLPDNLRTCDVTKPYRVSHAETRQQVAFNLVTMWEVLEHIAETDLPTTLEQIRSHLAPDGYFVGSISLLEYTDSAGRPYHVTLRPRTWWHETFRRAGLAMVEQHPWDLRLFCRGNGPRFQDFHNYALHPSEGFHFVSRPIESGSGRRLA
ncbi:methyltransferase domain-containing protein [Ramlibacter sp. AW1]|uniref:Methyltransferase domain-containing protein n=1 Tax=Ramlibacter aurantiacus TaxID=2801330 RepID=A0A936ZL86_9BURK|nr:methyltransferase domain-containing protein [Ramlibacter aurantiacus]MBL0422263.1 methyltransferase domain-containing protein [Ramlibacter aurantiacus]